MLVKKLSKTDSVTKMKAMDELKELVATKPDTETKKLIPYWPRLFNKLATDYDWRVREQVLKLHGYLVDTFGKSFAPHVKSVMAIWVLTLFDPYPPAACAAKAALNHVFKTPEKQMQAIRFCRNEILKVSRLWLC